MLIMETQAVGPFFKNGFVIGCEETRDAILIDPGDEVDGLLAFARRAGLTIRHILLTHAHVDHVSGVPAAKRALDVPVYLHRDDLFLYDRAVQQGERFGVAVEALPPIDVFYTSGQRILFGEYETRPHHTPGHCPGGVCLQVVRKNADLKIVRRDADLQIGRMDTEEKHLFVGDTLFAGSIGRTDLPGGDYSTLIRSITGVLFSFGDDAEVHPGHGPSTTIGQERRTNPFLTSGMKP